MKTAKYPLILLIVSLLFFSCDNSSSTTAEAETTDESETATETAEATEAMTASSSDDISLAVCLWPEVGLRSKAGRGKDAKWLAGMKFGEVVTLTGNEEMDGDRKYLEMELIDGKTGWANDYLFAVNAQRAVATATLDVYRRPDLTTFEGKQFEKGEILAVSEDEKDGWREVYGLEKKKAGWIQPNTNYSTDEVDVTVAILYAQALMEKSPLKQEEKLQNIAKNSTFNQSQLMSVVDEKLIELGKLTQLPANQLMVTTDNLNVRSEPDSEADNIVFKLQAGDICNILERGEAKVEIRNMNDFWYLIEKDGKEGWIFGYFTSKKLEE